MASEYLSSTWQPHNLQDKHRKCKEKERRGFVGLRWEEGKGEGSCDQVWMVGVVVFILKRKLSNFF